MLKVGSKVVSNEEHPNAVGEVIRVNASGDCTIEWVTPKSAQLPFGHVITEFWPASDVSQLIVIEM